MVRFKLTKKLNERVEKLVQDGLFKSKSDLLHEAIRNILMRYELYHGVDEKELGNVEAMFG